MLILRFLLKGRTSSLKQKLDHGFSTDVSQLLNLQKIIAEVEGLRMWQPTQRDKPLTNQSWWVQKWFLVGEGRRAWLLCSRPHRHMDGWKDKKDVWKDIRPSCTRPAGLFGCHPHTVTLSSVIFLDAVAVSDFSGGLSYTFVKHIRFPKQQLSLALMDLACLHPLAFLITLSRDLLSPTIKLMNLAI